MSMVPMGGNKISPNPGLVDSYPDVYLEHRPGCREPRAAVGHLARPAGCLRSPQPSEGAGRDRGRTVSRRDRPAEGAVGGHERQRAERPQRRFDATITFDIDEGPRRDTSPEALAKLRPAFHAQGTVTAGNSSQTSDGAAAGRDRVRGLCEGARPEAAGAIRRLCNGRCRAGAVRDRSGAGDQEGLKMAGLTLDQIDLIELNEAFAAQVLACLKELPIDPDALQRQRRRDRARSSAGLHRRKADGDARSRDAATRQPIRPRHDVRRRWHGSGWDFRTALMRDETN